MLRNSVDAVWRDVEGERPGAPHGFSSPAIARLADRRLGIASQSGLRGGWGQLTDNGNPEPSSPNASAVVFCHGE